MGRRFSSHNKVTNIIVTPEFLQSRIIPIGPYPKQKWIEFCETLMAEGIYPETTERADHG